MAIDICSSTAAAVTAGIIILSILYYYIKNRNILPGPWGLPYLGLFPVLSNENGHLELQEYGKKYGDLFSFTFTGKLLINLGSAKALREVHVNKSDCFAGRFTDFSLLTYLMPEGVAFANGEPWKVLRKYFNQAFKEYGLLVIRDNTTGPIYDTLALTLEDLRKQNGKSFNVIEVLTERCTTVIRKVMFGENGMADEDMREMLRAYAVSLDGMTGIRMLMIGPLAKFIYHIWPPLRRSIEQHRIMSSLLKKIIKNIESSMDEDHPTCVVEDFYKERNIKRRKNDPTWKYFSDAALLQSLTQFVGDGIVAVAYFIGIFLHGLVEHPVEQQKIYEELMDVVGPDRMPSIEDKSKLRYTNAYINEVMRNSNFFPLFPSMECTKETTVRGYRIPKGAITLLNSWQSNHDPETYENPYKFDPSRYIATPEKPRAELPALFGMGKRSCSGEAYAMTQAFLFLTNIVKNFKIEEPENPTTKSQLFLMTGNMELCITPRAEK